MKIKSTVGFTLVELLTVVAVVAVIGALIGFILTFSLRGTNKTNSTNEVRQNGNYAILQMSKMIEYAKSFDGVSTDGESYTHNCTAAIPPSPTPTPTPSQYNYIKITNFDGAQTVFACLSSSPPTIASNTASLLDITSVSVDSGSCYFTCSQERITVSPIVGINFSLSKKTKTGGVFNENKASIPFQTSVTMRNLGK